MAGTSLTADTTKKVRRGSESRKQYTAAYLLMAPFLLIFLVFTIWPVIFSFFISFTSYNVFNNPSWLGINNYLSLAFYDDIFMITLKNTFQFAIIVGPIGYIMCLFFAWTVNELSPKLRAFMTTVFYAPSISGAIFTIWLIIFDGDIYGYLNSTLMNYGIISDPINWLRDPTYMLTIVIIVQLWVSFGTSFLTLRAGFNTIDRQFYEASAVDGIKNRWQELWFITLPIMKPHLTLAAVLSITSALGSGFVSQALCGMPSVNYSANLLILYLQDYGVIRQQRGYAAAIATILFLASVGVNKLAQIIIGRIGR